jgi:hypothetical protein
LGEFKKPLRGFSRHPVMRPQAEDTGDQYFERIPLTRDHLVNPGELEGSYLSLQNWPEFDKLFGIHLLFFYPRI